MRTRIVDLLTGYRARYENDLEPYLWRLRRYRVGDALVSRFPRWGMDALTDAVSHLQSQSEIIRTLEQSVADLHVAQIGGVTRTFFDDSKKLVRFNTHDWRSGSGSEDSSEYVRIEKGTVLPWSDDYFDVAASRHVLEHISNPIAAIIEWTRVLKPGGCLFISVPDRRKTKEHRRKLTAFEHFIEDFKNNVPEFDPSHEPEIRQAGCGIIQHDRYENPHIHYHTYEIETLSRLLSYCGLELVSLSVADLGQLRFQPWDLILMARKPLS